MKKIVLLFCGVCVLGTFALAQEGKPTVKKAPPVAEKKPAEPKKPTAAELKNIVDQASYGFGMNIGNSLKDDGIEINQEMFIKGLTDVLGDKKQAIPDAELRKALASFQQIMQERQRAKYLKDVENNKKAGEAYLAKNKKAAGVTTTKSGLQYKVIKAGKGATPKETDLVKVHYKGTLINGKVFDESIGGDPAEFPVNRVIPGWTEALQLMKVGSKVQLVIPSDLAYGPRGSGRDIGPNETLIFEVELLSIVEIPKSNLLPPKK